MPSSNAPSSDSPRKTHRVNSSQYRGEKKVEDVRRELVHSMTGKFVKKPVDSFFDNAAPLPNETTIHSQPDRSTWKNVFDEVKLAVSKGDPEKKIQEAFVNAFNAHGLCGDKYTAVCTQNRSDTADPVRQKPDCGLYLANEAPTDNRTDWGALRMSIEFKKDAVLDDPFEDGDKTAKNKNNRKSFEAESKRRKENRGQIISYMSEMLARQHRCFAFSIIVFGDCVRIILWDRSGALVTEKFNYTKEPDQLCEFLWRWSCYSDEQQGLDPTVTLVKRASDDYKKMVMAAREKLPFGDYVREYFERSLDSRGSWPCWKILVRDVPPPQKEATSDSSEETRSASAKNKEPETAQDHYFLVGRPHFEERSAVGRGTRGYVALDCQTGRFVFLKDAWRVDISGIDAEGDVLRKLAAKEVRNIPTVLCHGDVGVQKTLADKLWQGASATSRNPLKPHRHYRLAENEVGRPLDDFINGRELLRRIFDCLVAHQDAYEKCDILHRDISSGNMLIVEFQKADRSVRRRGLLNDWELSKKVPRSELSDSGSSARQPDRTGTWHFLSVASLLDKNKQITIQDDLESFFHVLLFYTIRYLPTNCTDVGDFVLEFFEAARFRDGEFKCGWFKQSAIKGGQIFLPNSEVLLQLRAEDKDDSPPHPLHTIFSTLLSWFKGYYALRAAQSSSIVVSGRVIHNPDTAPEDDDEDDALLFSVVKKKQSSSQRPVQPSRMSTAEYEENAAKLNDHSTITDYFADCLLDRANWSKTDKLSDRLPAAHNFYKTGSKRSADALTEEDYMSGYTTNEGDAGRETDDDLLGHCNYIVRSRKRTRVSADDADWMPREAGPSTVTLPRLAASSYPILRQQAPTRTYLTRHRTSRGSTPSSAPTTPPASSPEPYDSESS